MAKMNRIVILVDDELLAKINTEAKKYYLDRGPFIRVALERFFRLLEKERNA